MGWRRYPCPIQLAAMAGQLDLGQISLDRGAGPPLVRAGLRGDRHAGSRAASWPKTRACRRPASSRPPSASTAERSRPPTAGSRKTGSSTGASAAERSFAAGGRAGARFGWRTSSRAASRRPSGGCLSPPLAPRSSPTSRAWRPTSDSFPSRSSRARSRTPGAGAGISGSTLPRSGSRSCASRSRGGSRTSGIARSPDEILVVSGAQQGLDLLFRTFTDPEDVVAAESPDLLRGAHARAARRGLGAGAAHGRRGPGSAAAAVAPRQARLPHARAPESDRRHDDRRTPRRGARGRAVLGGRPRRRGRLRGAGAGTAAARGARARANGLARHAVQGPRARDSGSAGSPPPGRSSSGWRASRRRRTSRRPCRCRRPSPRSCAPASDRKVAERAAPRKWSLRSAAAALRRCPEHLPERVLVGRRGLEPALLAAPARGRVRPPRGRGGGGARGRGRAGAGLRPGGRGPSQRAALGLARRAARHRAGNRAARAKRCGKCRRGPARRSRRRWCEGRVESQEAASCASPRRGTHGRESSG